MRNTALLTLVLASLLAGAGTAHADQCAWNDPVIAQKAAAIVKKGSLVLEFCEPCHDAAADKPYVVQTVSIDQKRGELIVDGKGMDLAYLYVQTGPKQFKNVGLEVSCGAADVSATIDDGKPSGRTKRSPHQHGPSSPSRPAPAPPPRATSISELAGTWTIRLETRYSTCPGIKVGPSTTSWNMQVAPSGQITVKGDDGTELVGAQDTSNTRMIRGQLKPVTAPSGLGFSFTLGWKDSFFGHLVRAESSKKPGDPVCVVHQEVSGRKVATP